MGVLALEAFAELLQGEAFDGNSIAEGMEALEGWLCLLCWLSLLSLLCLEGLLELLELQLEGKKRMETADFLRGSGSLIREQGQLTAE